MGYLAYDNSARVSFDDRVLLHLEVVIISKLQRKESFAMSWRESQASGEGRSTIWLDASTPLRFHLERFRPYRIDHDWLRRLSASAASSEGLVVTDQDGNPCTGMTHERGM